MDTIRVEISVREVASVSPDLWETRLYERLGAAGVPVRADGSLVSGTLQRFDDPSDFGKMVYVWTDGITERLLSRADKPDAAENEPSGKTLNPCTREGGGQ